MKKTLLILSIIFLFSGVAYGDVFGPKQTYRVYEVDSGVTDQGLATGEGNRSVKDFEDMSGTTPMVLMYPNSMQSGTSGHTDYVFLTAETTSSHIIHKFANGAMFAPASGVTVTAYSPDNIDAQPTQQVFTGSGGIKYTLPGTVEAGWYGLKGDNSTDNSSLFSDMVTSLDITSATYYDNNVHFTSGIYLFGSEVVFPASLNRSRFIGELGTIIKFSGSVDVSKAIWRLTASSTRTYVQLGFDNMLFTAEYKAGYCIVLEGTAGAVYNNSGHEFNRCEFQDATVVNVLIGDNTEPAGKDVNAGQTVFNKCRFFDAPYNVKLNGANVIQTTFRDAVFGESGVPSGVTNHVRNINAGDTRIHDSEFTQLASVAAGVYCVYNKSAPLSIRDIHSEDCRLIDSDDFPTARNQEHIIMENISVYDSRATMDDAVIIDIAAGTGNQKGRIEILNCYFNSQSGASTHYNRLATFATGVQVSITNSNFGPEGYVLIGSPERAIIDGMRPLEYDTLNDNPLVEYWSTSALPYGYTFDNGGGATNTLAASNTNSVHGNRTALVTINEAITSVCGLTMYVPRGQADCITVIFSGAVSGVTTIPGIDQDTGVSATVYKYINPDTLKFFGWVEIQQTTLSLGQTEITVGAASGVTGGTMYIDTVSVIPNKIGWGMHSAMYPKPDKINPVVLFGAAAPTLANGWRVGDIIWNSGVTSSGTPGWICTTAGTPGTWTHLPDLVP